MTTQDLNKLGYKELMQCSKPSLCDYIVELRGNAKEEQPKPVEVTNVETVLENSGLDPVMDAPEIKAMQAAGEDPPIRTLGKKKAKKKKKK